MKNKPHGPKGKLMEMKSSVDKTALGFKTVRGELDEIRKDVHGKLTSLKEAVDKVEERTNKLLKMEKKSEARIRRLEDNRYDGGENWIFLLGHRLGTVFMHDMFVLVDRISPLNAAKCKVAILNAWLKIETNGCP